MINKTKVFGVTLREDEILVSIALEKMLINKNNKIILVEGELDKLVYQNLFDRENRSEYSFIECQGKKNIISYIEFDNDPKLFGIIDRDFDYKKNIKNIITTKYACLEADIINCENIDDLFSKFPKLSKYKKHIKILNECMKKTYKGLYAQLKGSKPYKKEYLCYDKEEDFISNKMFKQQKLSLEYNDYDSEVHCGKYIIKILNLLNGSKPYNCYIMMMLKKMQDSNPLIQLIVKNKNFD